MDNKNISSLTTSIWGWLFYLIRPSKSSISKKNMDRVFSEILSSKELRHLRVAYYSHILLCIKEIFLVSLLPGNKLQQRIILKGAEHLDNALKKNKGVIVLLGHLGNWEFSPLFFPALMKCNKSTYHCVRKSLRFPFLNRIFWNRFSSAGFSVINKQDAIKNVRVALQNQEVVFFPFDLKPKSDKASVSSNFLGQPSLTYSSPACLADRYDCPVLSSSFSRIDKKNHVLEFHPEISRFKSKNRKETYQENTHRFNKRLETMILAHPEQWLWSYKRW